MQPQVYIYLITRELTLGIHACDSLFLNMALLTFPSEYSGEVSEQLYLLTAVFTNANFW